MYFSFSLTFVLIQSWSHFPFNVLATKYLGTTNLCNSNIDDNIGNKCNPLSQLIRFKWTGLDFFAFNPIHSNLVISPLIYVWTLCCNLDIIWAANMNNMTDPKILHFYCLWRRPSHRAGVSRIPISTWTMQQS